MGGRSGLGVIVIAVVAGGGIFWQYSNTKKAENQTGLLSSRVLSAVFDKRSEIRVAKVRGEIFAKAEGCSLRCTVPNRQETTAPYSINYYVSIKDLPVSAFRWNAKDNIMSVDLPKVRADDPAIDMSRAQVKQEGLWISRESGVDLQRKAVNYIKTRAIQESKNPEHLAKAQENARGVVENFVAGPLAAAGLANVKVVVRFDGEPKPPVLSNEQWDMSRPISEVLAEIR